MSWDRDSERKMSRRGIPRVAMGGRVLWRYMVMSKKGRGGVSASKRERERERADERGEEKEKHKSDKCTLNIV